MNRPILVMGGEGMLGHKVLQHLQGRFDTTVCSIRGAAHDASYLSIPLFTANGAPERIDVMHWEDVERMMRLAEPAVVVNCVGVIKQRSEATDPIPSITINALFPHRLARLLAEWGGRLVHISTDCVFSGAKGNYTELDIPDATDLYGQTKALGEVTTENAITLRTSIIGRELAHHRSLLDWFLSHNGRSVRGFTRVWYSGVTTNYLAKLIGNLIANGQPLSGLYQVAGERITKHDLLCLIRDAFGLDISIAPDDTEVSDRTLCGDLFVDTTGWRTPPWSTLIAELAADSTPYEQWTGFPRVARG